LQRGRGGIEATFTSSARAKKIEKEAGKGTNQKEEAKTAPTGRQDERVKLIGRNRDLERGKEQWPCALGGVTRRRPL